jgi:hypothetical protein
MGTEQERTYCVLLFMELESVRRWQKITVVYLYGSHLIVFIIKETTLIQPNKHRFILIKSVPLHVCCMVRPVFRPSKYKIPTKADIMKGWPKHIPQYVTHMLRHSVNKNNLYCARMIECILYSLVRCKPPHSRPSEGG